MITKKKSINSIPKVDPSFTNQQVKKGKNRLEIDKPFPCYRLLGKAARAPNVSTVRSASEDVLVVIEELV